MRKLSAGQTVPLTVARPAAQPGLRTWIVEWSLPVALGDNPWDDAGGVVPQACYSFAPEIGRVHESRYQPLPERAP